MTVAKSWHACPPNSGLGYLELFVYIDLPLSLSTSVTPGHQSNPSLMALPDWHGGNDIGKILNEGAIRYKKPARSCGVWTAEEKDFFSDIIRLVKFFIKSLPGPAHDPSKFNIIPHCWMRIARDAISKPINSCGLIVLLMDIFLNQDIAYAI